MRLKPLSALLGAVVLWGCTTSPITGRSQLALVPEDQIIAASAQAYTQEMGELRREGKVDNSSATASRVRAIAGRVIEVARRTRPETADWNWQVNVIRDPQANAFAMAGGKMAVYTGLVDKLRPTDDELAQVIAHEVGHALAGHSREKASVQMGTDLAVALAGLRVGEGTQQLLAQAAMLGVQLPNSRGMESEADRIGIELAAKAGYDPRAAVSLWRKMGQLQGRGGAPELLSTHPSDERRIAELAGLAPQMRAYYDASRRSALSRSG